MAKAKHTETPWAVCHTAGHEKHGQSAVYAESDGRDVAIVYDGDADAEFIVRAVNAHDGLVSTLKALLGAADDVVGRWEIGDLAEAVCMLDGARDDARDALKALREV